MCASELETEHHLRSQKELVVVLVEAVTHPPSPIHPLPLVAVPEVVEQSHSNLKRKHHLRTEGAGGVPEVVEQSHLNLKPETPSSLTEGAGGGAGGGGNTSTFS